MTMEEFSLCNRQVQIILEALTKIDAIAQDGKVTKVIVNDFGIAIDRMFDPLIALWLKKEMPEERASITGKA